MSFLSEPLFCLFRLIHDVLTSVFAGNRPFVFCEGILVSLYHPCPTLPRIIPSPSFNVIQFYHRRVHSCTHSSTPRLRVNNTKRKQSIEGGVI
jgi:hypothetical protein